MAADCKSALSRVHRFESCPFHHYYAGSPHTNPTRGLRFEVEVQTFTSLQAQGPIMKNGKSFGSSRTKPAFRGDKARDGGKRFYPSKAPKTYDDKADARKSDARPSDPRKSDVRKSDPRKSDFRKADPRKSDFKSDARKSDFRKTDPRKADPRKSDFRKPDFSKPDFRKTDRPKPGFAKKTAPPQREEFRPAQNTVLLWGIHACRAAWLNPKRRITRIWLTESGQKAFDKTQTEAREELLKRPDAKKCDREELDRMTPPSSVHNGVVIEVLPLPEKTLHDVIGINPPPDLILMLDQVTDPHNVGAILRSAAAFGAGAVIMTERNAPTTTGVLAKSASGALEYTPMVHVVNLARALDDLREAGYWSVGLAEEGEKSLGQLDLSGRTVLVLGNEGEGLRHLTRQKCDELAKLPTGGPVGSLNVSNAAAVGLYEVRRQAK
jgi:23S rRNA (guanosine2251-2'-O)-methyltransferase